MPFQMPRSKTLSPWQRNKRQEEGVRIKKSTQKFRDVSPNLILFLD